MKELDALKRMKDNTTLYVSQDYDYTNYDEDYSTVESTLENISGFTLEELDFLINYCNGHIADCEDMTYSVSEENCKMLGVYENLEWYENLRDKLIKLKEGKKDD